MTHPAAEPHTVEVPERADPVFDAAPLPPAPPPAEAPPVTLALGKVCERLGFTLSREFIADRLNIQPYNAAGRAVLYTEVQYRDILAALIRHLQTKVEAA